MILVTGGTGLLGSYLLFYLLEKQSDVCVLTRENSSTENTLKVFKELNPSQGNELFNQIKWIEASLFDIPLLEEIIKNNSVDEIYHCAGLISFDESKKKKIFKINYESTVNLLNIAIDKKINKFCYISSIASLGKSENGIINEKSEFNNKDNYSSYALSKRAAEMEVFRASQEGLNTVIVNPGVIIGSHHWNKKSSLLFKLNDRKKAYHTSGLSHLIDASDVAKCSIELMENNLFNEKFILVSNSISFKNQNNIIRSVFNKKSSIYISDSKLNAFYYLSKLLKPFTNKLNEFNRYTVDALTNKQNISNQKVKETLNFEFISVEDSLKHHAKNYLKYKTK
ncbi:MAG: NAD-dependent epimerase/dehydratase family protein [Flavobacteriales bacterium]|nr:NAD-dependent epimerase/dehydratase family protein [Flavobacteriales bacterium]